MTKAARQSILLCSRGLFVVLGLAGMVARSVAVADEADGAAKVAVDAAVGPGQISGQVLFDKDGSIAPDAKVLLLFPPPKGKNVYIGALPLRETIADSQGRFVFDSLPPGKYRVWANLGKLTSRLKQHKGVEVVITEANAKPGAVDLRLVDGVTVVISVKDQATGQLIPNATVHPTWSDFKDDFHATSNSPITVQPLTREMWRLEVWAKGFARQSRSLSLDNGGDQDLEFQLLPGGNLTGVVRDPEGNPVEGVGLSVRLERDYEQLAYIETDKLGQYRLDYLPLNADLSIRVAKVEWLDQTMNLRLMEAEQVRELTMVPRPHGGTIEGLIVDQEGNLIPNAELTNMGRSSNEVRKAKSDEQGRYKLDNLYEGSHGYEVVVRASRFSPQRLTVEPGSKENPTKLDILMEPGHRITGKVVDEKGRGIDGVTIFFANGHRVFGTIGGQGKTDKEGRFQFDSLPADCPFYFQKKGFSTISSLNLDLDTDQEITVPLIPMGVILGKVIDGTTGKPIKKFNVRLTFSPERRATDPNGTLPSDWIKVGRSFQSEAGAFQLPDLISGMPLQVMVEAEGYETAINKRVDAACLDDASEVAFTLEPVDPKLFRKYSGRLMTAEQKPASGVQVRLIVARNRNQAQRNGFPYNWSMIQNGQISDTADIVRFLSAVTDKDGRFEFRNVPRNVDTELAWWGANAAPGRLDQVETWDENVGNDIVLPQPSRIKGRIDLKKYEKLGHIQVHNQGDDDLIGHVQIELKPGQTEFEIPDLPAGSYSISLMGPHERTPGNDGSMTSRRLDSVNVDLEEGQVKIILFGTK